MDNGVERTTTTNSVRIARKSWTAYLRPLIVTVFLFAIGAFTGAMSTESAIFWWVVAVVYLVLRSLSLYSFQLFTDIDGVWQFRGILPWTKRVTGVPWHNFDEALFKTGFRPWLLKSYSVWVTNRYTKHVEIHAKGVHRGDRAVGAIWDTFDQWRLGGDRAASQEYNEARPRR